MGNWFSKNFKTIIYVSFLIPIITVAVVSISHVTQWYGISNPLSWALYLSIGVEIAALSALAAISAQMGSKVYFPFGIVTLIQFVGNIFFAFQYIKIDSQQFLSWVELTGPILEYTGIEQGDLQSHRRFLAIFAGGMLPLISLSFLHMLVKFNEENRKQISSNSTINENIVGSTNNASKNNEVENDKPSNITDDEINEVIDGYRKEKEVQEPIRASDLIAEISRFRPSEEDLKDLENLLNKFKPEEPKERPTKEEQREILVQMMKDNEEMGLYDEPFDNPLIRKTKTPQNASEMMITSDEDIINSIPSDNETSNWDDTTLLPTWLWEIPELTEDDFINWDVTISDGLEHIDEGEIKNIQTNEPQEVKSINVVLDELPTPSTDFELDVKIETPEPSKKIPNKYEVIQDYIDYTRGYDQSNTEEIDGIDVIIDELPTQEEIRVDVQITTPTTENNPNFVVREPIQDQEDPEKKKQ